MKLPALHTVSVKCPYSELFWCVFSRIRTEYGPEKLWIQSLFTLWLVLPNHMNKIMHICDISNVTEITTLLISPILLKVSALRQHYWNYPDNWYDPDTWLKLCAFLILQILMILTTLLILSILLNFSTLCQHYWNYPQYWYHEYYLSYVDY